MGCECIHQWRCFRFVILLLVILLRAKIKHYYNLLTKHTRLTYSILASISKYVLAFDSQLLFASTTKLTSNNIEASSQNSLKMEANEPAVIIYNTTTDPGMKKYLHTALEVSSKLDTTLAGCSNKLEDLENLLSHLLLADENHIVTNAFENDICVELIEKIFTFDLHSVIVNLKLRELDDSMGALEDITVDALCKVSSCQNSTELVTGLVCRLHGSERLLKQSRDRVLEMKIQLAKLHINLFSSARHDWDHGLVRMIEPRDTPRMLEKCLTRELEFEKKLKELKQNEEDLKSKAGLVEQVALHMEEAAEVAWGRFMEADSTAEVLMGISKDVLEKLHIAQFNLSRSTKREEEKNHRLQDFTNQLRAKEAAIMKLSGDITRLDADNAEVKNLSSKAQKLEENLKITETKLEEANALNEKSRERIKEIEFEIDALREKTRAAERRAESAEEKAAHLNELNLELSEEVDFLKAINDSNTKKVSVLEKKLRELDSELQYSRASSIASKEQQLKLYAAIWDMEKLIDELKQKAESKTKSAEEIRVMLSETDSDINKTILVLRSRVEHLENSLNQAALEKKMYAEDIRIRSSQIMETASRLAVERERIQKQVYCFF
ncbi:hypothetical protein OROGR_010233 [Orobanche gracilis]